MTNLKQTFNCDVCGEDKPVSEKHHGYPYQLETTWCDACGESSLVAPRQPMRREILHIIEEMRTVGCTRDSWCKTKRGHLPDCPQHWVEKLEALCNLRSQATNR